MIELIDVIIDEILIESKSNPILKDDQKALEAISCQLNEVSLRNKKLNTSEIYGCNSHDFIIAYEKNCFYLIDLHLDEILKDKVLSGTKCMQIEQREYDEYIQGLNLGIKDDLLIRDVYNNSLLK